MSKKTIGFNYLHRHPEMERKLKIDDGHVILDKRDWQDVVDVFKRNPDLVDLIGKPLTTPMSDKGIILDVNNAERHIFKPMEAHNLTPKDIKGE